MGTAAAKRRTADRSPLSVEDYLELDATTDDVRFEYDDGRVYALAGAQPEHVQIVTNLVTALHTTLRERGCRVLATDQRVQVGEKFYYPDVGVVCDSPEYGDDNPPSLRNPNLLVEVTSPSTARRDHEAKLDAYTRIGSLGEYWIVSSDRPLLLQHVRRGEEWVIRIFRGRDASVHCDAFDVDVALTDVYDLVDWEELSSEVAPPESQPDEAPDTE
jgi:Uma2 family endonuclease